MADGKGKSVMENELSHCGEDNNQNLCSPQSKTTKLRKRKVKEADASALNKKKKKNKAVTTEGAAEVLIALPSPTSKVKVGIRQPPSSPRGETPNQPAVSQANIQPSALNSVHEVPNVTNGDQRDGVNLAANSVHPSGSNSATPLPVAADADVGGAARSSTLSKMLGNGSSLQPKKQCPAAAVLDVEGYKVKQEFAATAQHILNKHGDIVSVTSFKGSLLTHLLENVCRIYQKLEKSDFMDLTIEELEVMCIELHDFQKMNVNVGWLLSRLEDILHGKKVLQTLNQELMEAKEKFKRFLEMSLVDDI